MKDIQIEGIVQNNLSDQRFSMDFASGTDLTLVIKWRPKKIVYHQ